MPLPKNASASDYIHDFVASTNKRFEGKSKKERIKMALGAYYASATKPRKRRKSLKEDAVPVNNVAAGNIAGLSDPGIKKTNKRRRRQLRDIISSAKLN